MDFASVAKKLAGAGLTTLATSILGPAGPMVSGLLCGWLGLDSSSSDAQAQIEAKITDPAVLADLKAKEMLHEEALTKMTLEAETNRLANDTATIQAVNGTMQAEAKSEHPIQYSWRPACGFSLAISFFVVTVLVCILAYQAVTSKDMTSINMIPQLVGSFAALFACIMPVVGVAAWTRGQAQIAQIGVGTK